MSNPIDDLLNEAPASVEAAPTVGIDALDDPPNATTAAPTVVDYAAPADATFVSVFGGIGSYDFGSIIVHAHRDESFARRLKAGWLVPRAWFKGRISGLVFTGGTDFDPLEHPPALKLRDDEQWHGAKLGEIARSRAAHLECADDHKRRIASALARLKTVLPMAGFERDLVIANADAIAAICGELRDRRAAREDQLLLAERRECEARTAPYTFVDAVVAKHLGKAVDKLDLAERPIAYDVSSDGERATVIRWDGDSMEVSNVV